MDCLLDFFSAYKKLTFVLCLLLIVGIVYFGFFAGSQDTPLSVVGTLITTLGFMLTIAQLISVREVTLETKAKVDNAVKLVQTRMKEIFSVADCAAAQRIVDEVENAIAHGKYEIAVLRLKEIHKLLLSISNNELLRGISRENLNILVPDVALDINNLQDNQNTPLMINRTAITSHLRSASTVFIEIENLLKNKSYDSTVL